MPVEWKEWLILLGLILNTIITWLNNRGIAKANQK
jgi:hypothetical protein